MDTHKPWYQSPAVQGLLVIVITRLLAACKLSSIIPTDLGVQIANAALEALTAGGALWIARELKNPPTAITLTKAAADTANAISNPAPTIIEGNSNVQSQPVSVIQPAPPAGPATAAPDSNGAGAAPKP